MKTKIYIVFVILSLSASLYGQSLSPSVIALAGGLEKTPSGMTLSWTIGEPVIETLQTENIYLTQGFQQPNLQVSTGFEDPAFDYTLRTYPNPTSTELIMETDFKYPVQYRLVDLSGKLIHEGTWHEKHVLDVAALPQGIYAIYFQAEGKMVKSELIQKQ
jgi:hypothetical protein